MTEINTIIINPTGLHARPAAIFTKKAKSFKSSVRIVCGDKTVDAKSMIALLSAGISCGNEITIKCDGEDERQACEELVQLLKSITE